MSRDRSDRISAHADVGAEPRITGAVDDASVPDNEVVACRLCPESCETSRNNHSRQNHDREELPISCCHRHLRYPTLLVTTPDRRFLAFPGAMLERERPRVYMATEGMRTETTVRQPSLVFITSLVCAGKFPILV
jgi:hypothetical protein